jgi:hypothetical protein
MSCNAPINCPHCGETRIDRDERGFLCPACALRFLPGAQQVLRIKTPLGETIPVPVERVATVEEAPARRGLATYEVRLPVDRLKALRKMWPLFPDRLSLPVGAKEIPPLDAFLLQNPTLPPAELPQGQMPPQGPMRLSGTGGETGNFLRWERATWRIRYEDNQATFPDRADSVLRHLARLLAEPNRRFSAVDFYPPPAGKAPLPFLGHDESSDSQAMQEYERELRHLAQEIKDARDAHDAEMADKLRKQFDDLSQRVQAEKSARKRGHKKRCGAPSSIEKANQTLRMGFNRLYERFRKKGLEKLADHLEKHISTEDGEWFYAPPPETPPWQVTRPENER